MLPDEAVDGSVGLNSMSSCLTNRAFLRHSTTSRGKVDEICGFVTVAEA
jgi:hypothetical protein